jgi:hypothetical protein
MWVSTQSKGQAQKPERKTWSRTICLFAEFLVVKLTHKRQMRTKTPRQNVHGLVWPYGIIFCSTRSGSRASPIRTNYCVLKASSMTTTFTTSLRKDSSPYLSYYEFAC